jgi:diadenosine tetraphosphate (Ap4A) HIT family hydrolase
VTNCKICIKHKKVDRYLLFETDYFKVSHGPLESQIIGYLYIEPKRHLESWSEFTEKELSGISPLIQDIEMLLKELLKAERVYTVTISEAVKHLHFHIIPRLVGQTVKGLSLIEQATAQRVIKGADITDDQVINFIRESRRYLSI